MFVLSKEKSVRARDLIGVFDLDTATVSGVTRGFLSNAEKMGELEGTESLPKSFMLVSCGGRVRVYLSSRLAGYINRRD